MLRLTLVILAILALAAQSAATTVGDLVRIRGQGESILRGLGLIVGLPGTGDSGKDLVVARPLFQVLRNNGNPLLDFKEIEKSKSVALVMVMCVVPAGGARADDRIDVTVSVLNSASSLRGGTLYLAPLTGPYPGDPVYAVAQGSVEVEDDRVPTNGRVTGGARLVRDIMTGTIRESFDLVIQPYFGGWASASEIAGAITTTYYVATPRGMQRESLPPIATVVDDRTIRIDIPQGERADPAAFIAALLATDINTSQLKLPAQVIANRATGAIIVTGDVEISPVVITHKDLTITTTTPPPVPTPQDPLVRRTGYTTVQAPAARPGDRARIEELLSAFKQLDVPVTEQIAILSMIHKAGKLHARLIVE